MLARLALVFYPPSHSQSQNLVFLREKGPALLSAVSTVSYLQDVWN